MFERIENLKVLSVLHKPSKQYGKIESRNSHCINIRVCGKIEYQLGNKTLIVNSCEALVLPKGSKYEYKNISDVEAVATIINFDGDIGEVTPVHCSIKDFSDSEYVMYHIAELWNFGSGSNKCECLSHIYNLLCYIYNHEKLSYDRKKKFYIIDPAVDYLKKHIYDVNLKIDSLHELCGVSDTYFRKIFISRFGTNPKKYVLDKRMSYVKSVIDSGEFTTLKELATAVGYTDSLYLSKVFKKYYGISVTDMNEAYKM